MTGAAFWRLTRRRLALLAALALVLHCAVPAGSAALAAEREAVAAALQEVLSSGRYQTAIEPRDHEPPPERWQIPDWLAELLTWLGRIVLVAGVLALVFFLGRELYRLRIRRAADDAGAAAAVAGAKPGEAAALAATLEAADRLAQQGAHSEAIHMLLLAGIEALRRRLRDGLAASLTSHEILAVRALSEALRAPLARLVRAAELGHFGGRTFGQRDYQGCRDDYVAFVGEAEAS